MWFTIYVIICLYVLHVCVADFSFIFDSRLVIWGKKLSFKLSACSVLIVAPLLLMHPSFPLVSWNRSC